ncbi:UPF0755 protein [Mesocricetibacter intestinalis]|uniref:Endolytic murein transglycosylase n=1 Tax=Mesocricetibacter intestinalis TaxID=1521930 RepID=A0A4R6VCG5_9PAST|nr:endolytic transglycosylase MltG [Mesocricetibacter intestinalis]TDQ57973.1 UPF0755 protein [Mesocricetibacter intestinalis]
MKKCFVIFLLVVMLAVGAGFWGYHRLQRLALLEVNVRPDQLLTLNRGSSGKKLADLLVQENIIPAREAKWLPWWLKLEPELNKVKAGTYALKGVKTLRDLLMLLNSGKEAQFSLRFIEGDTFKSWQSTLQRAPHLTQSLAGKSEAEIFALLELPDMGLLQQQKKIEGWLYPDTYNYTPNSTDLALLKRAAGRMKQALEKAWREREADLPLEDPYQMLILASIVEKESAIAAERPQVASVFINRLKRKMKLQTDPTVIYGMGDEYQGNIRKKDLERPTAYNTYVIEGLPPTPIAMPSESSLQAVAKPAKTDFLYFVADGSGGHKFSRNLSEHNRAVQEYLRWYRSKQKDK